MNNYTGFNFLPASMHPVTDARRGYATGTAAPDPSTTGTTTVAGSAITIDKTVGHGVAYGTPVAHFEI